MPKLIFLFSLPRSGSTLLQRLLAVHQDIHTAAEPWILLPPIYSMRKKDVYAEFSWDSLTNAIADIISALPEKEYDYYSAIRSYADLIYSKLTPENCRYFLDKTPRYYFVVKEIIQIYPDAKFIFLFRHPLGMYSSVIQSFNRGHLGNVRHRIDVAEGPRYLVEGFKNIQQKCFSLQFEELIAEPERCLRNICDYLELEYSDNLLENFASIHFQGRMGDEFGTNKYKYIANEPTEKWKETFSTLLRKRHARNYIMQLQKDVVTAMGYDYETIIKEINGLPSKYSFLVEDCYCITRCFLYSFFEKFIFADKLYNLRRRAGIKYKYFVHT